MARSASQRPVQLRGRYPAWVSSVAGSGSLINPGGDQSDGSSIMFQNGCLSKALW